MYLLNFLLAFLLTAVVEAFVAFLFGFRTKNQLLAIGLINIITNPLLNFAISLNMTYELIPTTPMFLLFLETIVILFEWQLLCRVFAKSRIELLKLSVAMNATSFLIGLLIFGA